MVKFYLDNQLVENPTEWQEISTKIVRDNDLNAILVNQDLSLTFTGDGYSYLYNKLTEGYCTIVHIDIYYVDENCTHNIPGTIFISDTEFNELACTAKCKIEDTSFYAKVIKKNVFGGETKNFTRFYVLYKALSTENVENSVESVEKGLAA